MNKEYDVKESVVTKFINHNASCDELSNLYAYMNCVKMEKIDEEWDGDLSKTIVETVSYKIISGDNDDDAFQPGVKVSLDSIFTYLDNLLKDGTQDDIECMYDFIDK